MMKSVLKKATQSLLKPKQKKLKNKPETVQKLADENGVPLKTDDVDYEYNGENKKVFEEK